MIKKDRNCMTSTIPKLVILKTLQHMRRWKDKKAADEEKKQADLVILGLTGLDSGALKEEEKQRSESKLNSTQSPGKKNDI